MEKVVTNELSKTLIILAMGVLGISVLIKLITKVYGSFKPYQKATIIYLLIFLLFFAAIACTAFFSVSKKYFIFYILYQFYFLLLGVAHTYYMPGYLKWSGETRAIWLE